jgi:hypothetical protein
MQYLLNLCVRAGEDAHVFTEEELGAWPEPSELQKVATDLSSNRRALARVAQIRNLGRA